MMKQLKGRSLLTLNDYTREEIDYLVDLAIELKKKPNITQRLAGKSIVLIFDKPSTRTRCATEVAAHKEGASVTYLTNSQMGVKESVADTAKVLGRYYDAIVYRGSSQTVAEQLAHYSRLPLYNALTDDDHPTQVLADLMTIKEHLKAPFKELKMVYVGDGRNNVANALSIGAAKMGIDFVITAPKELINPDSPWEEDPSKAVQGANIIYTDVWFSMGEEGKMEERLNLLKPYQVNMELIQAADRKDLIFLHCLPAFHDLETTVAKEVNAKFGLEAMEVTDEVFRSDYSVVFDQAENRMHTIRALMVATLGN
jgi:ornithine carbamoyltransferase